MFRQTDRERKAEMDRDQNSDTSSPVLAVLLWRRQCVITANDTSASVLQHKTAATAAGNIKKHPYRT